MTILRSVTAVARDRSAVERSPPAAPTCRGSDGCKPPGSVKRSSSERSLQALCPPAFAPRRRESRLAPELQAGWTLQAPRGLALPGPAPRGSPWRRASAFGLSALSLRAHRRRGRQPFARRHARAPQAQAGCQQVLLPSQRRLVAEDAEIADEAATALPFGDGLSRRG